MNLKATKKDNETVNEIIVLTKGNPFLAGSHREAYWNLLLECRTDQEFKKRFDFGGSGTPASVLRWLLDDGHIRLKKMTASSTPLTTAEIRTMITRLRGAQIAASVNSDPHWVILAEAVHALQRLHKIATSQQF